MCDDLIRTHFFNASATGSSRIITETPNAHVFVHNHPSNQLLIFLPPDLKLGPEEVGSWLARVLPDNPAGKGFRSWIISTYNKETALTVCKEWKATSFDVLYEMRRPALPNGTAQQACPTGFVIQPDPNFLQSHDPARVSAGFLASETTLTIADESTGDVAGFLTSLSEGGRTLLSGVHISPKYRRRGMAKALMTSAMESMEGQSTSTIWLHVFAENAGAVAMYFGLGFTVERCLWLVGGANP